MRVLEARAHCQVLQLQLRTLLLAAPERRVRKKRQEETFGNVREKQTTSVGCV